MPEAINSKEKVDELRIFIGKTEFHQGGKEYKQKYFADLVAKSSKYLHPDIIQAGKILNERFGDITYLVDSLAAYLSLNLQRDDKLDIPTNSEYFYGISSNVVDILDKYAYNRNFTPADYPKFSQRHYIDSTILFAQRYIKGME